MGKALGQVAKSTVNIGANTINLGANIVNSVEDIAHGKNILDATGISDIGDLASDIYHGQNVMESLSKNVFGSALGNAFVNTTQQLGTGAQALLSMKSGIKINGYDLAVIAPWGAIHDYAAEPFQSFSEKYTHGMLGMAIDIALMPVFGQAAPFLNPLNLDMPPTGSTIGIVSTNQKGAIPTQGVLTAYNFINYKCLSNITSKIELPKGNESIVMNAVIKVEITGANGTPNRTFTTQPFAIYYGENIELYVDPKTATASIFTAGPSTQNKLYLVNCASNTFPGFANKLCGCSSFNGPLNYTKNGKCATTSASTTGATTAVK